MSRIVGAMLLNVMAKKVETVAMKTKLIVPVTAQNTYSRTTFTANPDL